MESIRATQLALLQSAPSTVICSRSAYCLMLLHVYRRMHPPDTAIRAVSLCPRLELGLKLHSTSSGVRAYHPHACCVCQRHKSDGCARKAAQAPRHTCSALP